MRAMPVIVVLVAAALAGCSDSTSSSNDGDTKGTPQHGAHGGMDAATHILAPTWEAGQWWTLASDQASGPFTHVVSGEAGTDWIVDTDSADIAFFDARFDISFLGPVRKSDLAGSQGSERVEFFQFPLNAGKNWTTTWDGFTIKINVTSVAAGKAQLEARHANGTLYASYSYEANLGYFRDYSFYGPDGTTVAFAAKVTSSGKAFAGDLVRWTLEPAYEFHGPMVQAAQNFDVSPGLTDVWASVAVDCPAGAITLNFGPFTGPAQERGFSANGPCPMAFAETLTISAPVQQESWGVEQTSVPGATTAQLDLVILLRTQALFKAGAAP
ncbi:MAG: hypothetical protein AABY18_08810 [Candidatus Thermoplasmatota archaeon]